MTQRLNLEQVTFLLKLQKLEVCVQELSMEDYA
jgi:hypothetical protein